MIIKHIDDLKNATDDELIEEEAECERLWGRYSCECFGFYISALRREILDRNIWLKAHEREVLRNYTNRN